MDIRIKVFLVLLLAFIALAIAGTSDVQEAKRQEAQYIEFVCKGLWGDYKDLKPNCE
jgi:hypothetical protein